MIFYPDNPVECHLLLNTKHQTTLKIDYLYIKHSFCEKLLDINFDSKLNFAKDIEDICQKVSRKLNALARLVPYITSSINVFQWMLSSSHNVIIVP